VAERVADHRQKSSLTDITPPSEDATATRRTEVRERQARSSFAAACGAKMLLEASTRYSAYSAGLRWSSWRSQPTSGFQLVKIWLTKILLNLASFVVVVADGQRLDHLFDHH
jgi:hypothetical protein